MSFCRRTCRQQQRNQSGRTLLRNSCRKVVELHVSCETGRRKMLLSHFVSACRCQRLGVPHLRTRHPLADRRAARSAGPPAQQKHPAVSRGVGRTPSGPNTSKVLKQAVFSRDVVVPQAVPAHFMRNGINSGVCLRAAVTSTKWPADVQRPPLPRRGRARFLQLKEENEGEKLSC